MLIVEDMDYRKSAMTRVNDFQFWMNCSLRTVLNMKRQRMNLRPYSLTKSIPVQSKAAEILKG